MHPYRSGTAPGGSPRQSEVLQFQRMSLEPLEISFLILESASYTQMGPHGLQAARSREKRNHRQRSVMGKRHQGQRRNPRGTPRPEPRLSCRLSVTVRVLITAGRLLDDPRFFFVGAPGSVMAGVPANLLRSIRSTACRSLSRSVRHLPIGFRGIQRQEKAIFILLDGTVYEISTTWTYHSESASSTATQWTIVTTTRKRSMRKPHHGGPM